MIFEVTPEHIEALTDTDLRALVGLLAEQEVTKAGYSTVGVTYGGDQNAGDGGIDVRVDLKDGEISGYIPRAATGFQVKAENMTNQKTQSEMKPKGTLRPSIVELGRAGGAYIIISSKGSVSDTSLKTRRNAMSAAIAGEPDASDLHLDFYDRQRMATWVNQHPGLIPWVRMRVGQLLSGWRPFEDWSSSPGSTEEAYILDDHIRLISTKSASADGMKALEGVHAIRDILRKPMGAVRLVGLSGVGKTRFAQALFDPTLGESALNQHDAIYTDLSNSPDPIPINLLNSLQHLGRNCILIVDNCGAPLHRELVKRIKQTKANVRVLTIEYDVSDDKPEGTDTFKLEPASSKTVEKIVERRYPELTSPEIQTIAKFSEGNSRIALALAETAQYGESLANVTDDELIKRLFQQNHNDNPQLKHAAAVCSLVYSFDGENTEDANAELKILADIAGQPVDVIHGHVAELYRRQLVQKRSEWRAVLPHALAHKLAKRALQDVPKQVIREQLINRAPERMLKSFSRRLGYLHDSHEAQAIAQEWLSPGGRLYDIAALNSLNLTLLDNIAPINPRLVLKAIKAAADTTPGFATKKTFGRDKIIEILRSLAYDPDYFNEAAFLIARFTGSITKSNHMNEAINVFKSFFYLYFSGTHASVEQRADFLFELAKDGTEKFSALVIEGLSAILECDDFISYYNPEFGARRRDYGLHPKTYGEIFHWYRTAFDLVRKLSSLPKYEDAVKKMVASRFSAMASYDWLLDDLIALAEFLAAGSPWPEGWIGVCAAIRRVKDKKDTDEATKTTDKAKLLSQLALKLAPSSLADRIGAYVLPERWGPLDLADIDTDDEKRYERAKGQVEQICKEIGAELASDLSQFSTQLPPLFESFSYKTAMVARQVGSKADDKQVFWNLILEKAFASLNPAQSFQFASHFLAGLAESDTSTCEEFLDQALKDTVLHPFFVHMQAVVGLDGRGAERLIASTKLDTIPIATFNALGWGRVCDKLSTAQIHELLLPIALRKDGLGVAMHIFHMRLLGFESDKTDIPDQEKCIGQTLLSLVQFTPDRTGEARAISHILKRCLVDPSKYEAAEQLAKSLLKELRSYRSDRENYSELIADLGKTYPRVVLDVFVNRDTSTPVSQRDIFKSFSRRNACPLANITDELVIEWAREDPENRFLRLSQCIRAWHDAKAQDEENSNALSWTKLAMRILDECPNKVEVLSAFIGRFYPRSWSGSLANILQARLPLLEALSKSKNADIASTASATILTLTQEIERMQEREAQESRVSDERFEW